MLFRRFFALLLFLAWMLSVATASFASANPSPTATPPPVELPSSVLFEPPEAIQRMIEIAVNECVQLNGKKLPRSNKYTKWWNNGEWGWCAGFTTWCSLQAKIPQDDMKVILSRPEGESPESVYSCRASSPAKLIRTFLHMHRTTMIPQKGFFILYGDLWNFKTHVGIVIDVQLLSDGRYRLTTVEGNMGSTVQTFVADYKPVDVYNEQNHSPKTSNLSPVPEEEREEGISPAPSYRLRVSDTDGSPWYVTCFLMTWLPGDGFLVIDHETAEE